MNMKEIKHTKGVRVLGYSLRYIQGNHELFSISKGFAPGKFTIVAVNGKGTYESVIAVCSTKKMAREIIEQDLNGKVI